MKKINYYLGALALAAMGMTSCSDDIAPNDIERTDIERDIYVNIAIHGSNSASRSSESNGTPEDADFNAGIADESKINEVYLVFYDAVGNVVGNVTTANPTWGTSNPNGNNVEKVGTETLKVTLAVGQQQPSFVMCYINPTSKTNIEKPLNQLATSVVDAVVNPDGTFPMSNSVYFDASGNAVTATPIAGKYYATKELADAAAANGESVDIYVERYAAKIQMNDPSTTVTPYASGTMTVEALQGSEGGKMLDVTLTFVPKGWIVNGVAENSYAIKSFRKESDNGQVLPDEYSFAEMNERINGTYSIVDGKITLNSALTGNWTWNAPTYNRSYWSCSPVYFQSEYPEVEADYNPDNMAQTFYKYNEIVEQSQAYDTPYYVPETTVGARGLYSANPNAAVVSALLAGQYQLTVDGTEIPVGTTFYTYVPVSVKVGEGSESHASVYFEVKQTNDADDVTGASAIEVDGTLSMRNRFLWQNTVLYKEVGGKFVRFDMKESTDVSKLVAATKVLRPENTVLSMAVVGNKAVKMADRTRTLQITKEANLDGLYINDNGVVKKIVANNATLTENQITLDAANLILWQNVGTCNKYDKGAAAFNIPIKHLGWYRSGNTQMEDSKIDFAKVRVGDLGMVRNHSYSIQISSISGLAPGVGGVDNPIIPPAETQDVYVSYRVNVLEWAVVPTQSVDL